MLDDMVAAVARCKSICTALSDVREVRNLYIDVLSFYSPLALQMQEQVHEKLLEASRVINECAPQSVKDEVV